MDPILVVAAVVERDGKVLACRRATHKSLGGFWEFPGGKVDPGESDETALVREMLEELNVQVIVGEFIEKSIAPAGDLTIELRGFWATMAANDVASSTDHDEFRWIGPADIDSLNWAPADLPIVAAVKRAISV